MTRLFNGILRTGHFPGIWKTGRVITIPKTGKDPRLASIQRLITQLSHIANLFELITLRRLHRHLTPRREQFRFHSGHSTTLQLHPGLLYKLMNTQIPPTLVRTVVPFLEDRSFFVAVQDTNSDPRPIHAGIPQGSCLSTCLYALCTDDIPTLTSQQQDWEETVVLTLYADDSAYLPSSRRADLTVAKLQRVLDLLPDWLDKWRVAVNVTKTAVLLTGQQRIIPPKLSLRRQWNMSFTEQSRAEYAAPNPPIAPNAPNQSCPV
ncbi:RNA-directed DNA polymerase from mobile element jockey [Eumeta japonica]|uniref:RNA-directed DNA polymerase from mobile element jockey n=1 Tax=Eumeta variegata TaxID=151549 RepID=A0A4C1ZYK0_EUMVA|nr:RNA-directed DNA polymerase from mobile element jockey [Eumeta japonica]